MQLIFLFIKIKRNSSSDTFKPEINPFKKNIPNAQNHRSALNKNVKIVRETESESEVVPNLMIGFGIDEIQAVYVAEIKLRHLNREYILKRIKDIEQLENEIVELEAILSSKNKMKKIIIKELEQVTKKYDNGRKSEILYSIDESVEEEAVEIPDYPVTLFITEHGYFKKIKTANLQRFRQ